MCGGGRCPPPARAPTTASSSPATSPTTLRSTSPLATRCAPNGGPPAPRLSRSSTAGPDTHSCPVARRALRSTGCEQEVRPVIDPGESDGAGIERAAGRGPLAGYVVVDLSRALAGPHAAMMLGDLGARVIKVEAPGHGDESRGWGPPFVGPPEQPVSTYFLSCNRNKESVTADLKTADGKQFLTRLVRRADVLVENFRTGVLDRLGFGVDRLRELNPGLVILSITGFGHDGP